MSDINVNDLLEKMVKAAKKVLKSHWEDAKPFAEQELKSLAENIKLMSQLKLEGKITEEQAKYYIEIQKSSVRIVLLTIEGLGILAVESAINSAIDVIRSTVNTTIGWSIL